MDVFNKITNYYITLSQLNKVKWYQFRQKRMLKSKLKNIKTSIIDSNIFELCNAFMTFIMGSIDLLKIDNSWNIHNILIKDWALISFIVDDKNIQYYFGNSCFSITCKLHLYMVYKDTGPAHILEDEWKYLEQQVRNIVVETIDSICENILGV